MKRTRFFLCGVLLFLLAGVALSAPVLRLQVPRSLRQGTGEVQPIWITEGTNGPGDLFFEAWNSGDGSLDLTVHSGSAAWLTPEIGTTTSCGFDAETECHRVRVLFATSELEQGTYDGFVEVRDPNAVDAPRRVPIRIYVGSNVPERVDLFVAPMLGSVDTFSFQTPARENAPAPGGTVIPAADHLGVSSSGQPGAVYTHLVRGLYQPSLAVGDMNSVIQFQNSPLESENREIPVSLHVTNEPIAKVAPDSLQFVSTQGLEYLHDATRRRVELVNRGNGELVVTGVAVTTPAPEPWLSVAEQGDGSYLVTATAGALLPGRYEGVVRFDSNAANSPTEVRVDFEVRAAGGPEVFFRGVVNAASFSETQPLAPGAIAALFGVDLAAATEMPSSVPLPTNVATTKVLINGIEAPLFFVSYQ